MKQSSKKIPQELLESFSNYGPQIYDGWCGELIGWGYKILEHLGEEKFQKLGRYGSIVCVYPHWFLITKKLTRKEAIKKYGGITDEEFGSRGGWKSVKFGDKRFISEDLKE